MDTENLEERGNKLRNICGFALFFLRTGISHLQPVSPTMIVKRFIISRNSQTVILHHITDPFLLHVYSVTLPTS